MTILEKIAAPRLRTGLIVAAAALAGLVQAQKAEAQTYEFTMCAASVGGTWSLIGTGINSALREAYPGSTVTLQSSAGGIANAALLQTGTCDLGIMHSPEVVMALAGKPPFKEPLEDLRLIARIESWSPQQIMVSQALAEKYDLKTTKDIAEKQVPIRIVLQKPGNIGSAVAADILTESGASPENIEKWGGQVLRGASAEQANLIRDRRADASINSVFPGSASVLDIANALPITLLTVPNDVRAKVSERWQVPEFTIEAGTYEFIDEDIKTVTLGAHLMAMKSMSDEEVTALLTAIVDHSDKIATVHPSMGRLTVANFSGSTLPYHDAAVKFYESRDMMPSN